MEKITIREATPEDKEAVLRIHDNVYEGRDYLPAYYDHFLSSPDMAAAVMLYDNQIIAFEVGHIIDNGETVVSRAGRVNPKFEGQGLIKYFNLELRKWWFSKGVRRTALTVSDAHPYLSNPSFQKATKHITTKQFPIYYFAGEGVTLSEKDTRNTAKLNIVTDLHLSLFFKTKAIRDYISPSGRMIVDAVPYKMIHSNIQSIRGPKQFKSIYSDIKSDTDKCTGLLSVGTVFPIPHPQYKYMLDIFGSDTSSLKTHIVKHLIRLKEKTKGITTMLVYVPDEFDLEKVDVIFQEFGIVRRPHTGNPKLKSAQIYVFEGVDQFPNKL